jgi:hypothetical protein
MITRKTLERISREKGKQQGLSPRGMKDCNNIYIIHYPFAKHNKYKSPRCHEQATKRLCINFRRSSPRNRRELGNKSKTTTNRLLHAGVLVTCPTAKFGRIMHLGSAAQQPKCPTYNMRLWNWIAYNGAWANTTADMRPKPLKDRSLDNPGAQGNGGSNKPRGNGARQYRGRGNNLDGRGRLAHNAYRIDFNVIARALSPKELKIHRDEGLNSRSDLPYCSPSDTI